MKLVVENKFFSLGGGSRVKAENGDEVYKVKGKVFSPTHKKKIYDMQGNLLYVVRNKWFNWLHHTVFIYNADGEQIGKISKRKITVGNDFHLEDFVDEYKIAGRIVGWKFRILKNDQEIGTITRNFTFHIDKFTLETDDVENAQLYVAMIVAVDNITDKRQKDRD